MNKFLENVSLRKEAAAYKQLVKTLSRAARKGKIAPASINRLADSTYDDRLIRAMNSRLSRTRRSVIRQGKKADKLLDRMAANPALKSSRGDDAMHWATGALRRNKNSAYESVYRNPDAYYEGEWIGDKVMDLIGQRSSRGLDMASAMKDRRNQLNWLQHERGDLADSIKEVENLYRSAPKYK